jgi:hypothetical protein
MPPGAVVFTDIGAQDILSTPVDNEEIAIKQAGELAPDTIVSTDIGAQEIMSTSVDNDEILIKQAGKMPPDTLVSTDFGAQDIMSTPVDNDEIAIEQAGEISPHIVFLPTSIHKTSCRHLSIMIKLRLNRLANAFKYRCFHRHRCTRHLVDSCR